MSKAKELSELGDAVTVDSGNVGIGTSSPQATYKLTVSGTDTTYPSVYLENTTNSKAYSIRATGTSWILRDVTAGADRLTLDTSGNLLVNTASLDAWYTSSNAGTNITTSNFIAVARSGGACFIANRLTSDGDAIEIRKDGSTVGSISSISSGDTSYNSVNGTISLGGNQSNHIQVLTSTATGAPRLQPSADNTVDLGFSGRRFQDIFATNATIQTSDRNDKQDEADLSDAETRVAVAAKGLLKKFRWKSAVEEKGDEARIHFGIIAQDLQDAFAAEGLDASDYGMWCSDTWTDEETGEERTRLGVRYSELLAFIIAGI